VGPGSIVQTQLLSGYAYLDLLANAPGLVRPGPAPLGLTSLGLAMVKNRKDHICVVRPQIPDPLGLTTSESVKLSLGRAEFPK